mmetsp:Transcript_26174/g.87662  ORF Transcript_26174/g.87662 Transcript_26174/m.87662 type:complete len:227 (+) Transcript_26174:1375-2055(+)
MIDIARAIHVTTYAKVGTDEVHDFEPRVTRRRCNSGRHRGRVVLACWHSDPIIPTQANNAAISIRMGRKHGPAAEPVPEKRAGGHLLDRYQGPEAVVQIVGVLHGDPLVARADVLGAHQRHADRERVLLALRKDAHHRVRRHVVHGPAFGREARCHDVGSGQDKPDRAAVHAELGEHVRELVQHAQGGHEGAVPHLEEERHVVRPGGHQGEVVGALGDDEGRLLGQ